MFTKAGLTWTGLALFAVGALGSVAAHDPVFGVIATGLSGAAAIVATFVP